MARRSRSSSGSLAAPVPPAKFPHPSSWSTDFRSWLLARFSEVRPAFDEGALAQMLLLPSGIGWSFVLRSSILGHTIVLDGRAVVVAFDTPPEKAFGYLRALYARDRGLSDDAEVES